jgi:enterobacterial common antigen flippase
MSNKSYGQILKSSSIMGGTAGITMLLGMVRTKFAAVLIGTAGAGLLANFGAIQGMVGTLAGLGLGSSAVRDVAAALATGDQTAIGRTVLTLRRMCWLTGTVGMLAMMALSPMLAQWTFGNQDHTFDIAAIGLIIFFSNLSSGQTALINGMRRIGDLARLGVVSAVVGTVVSIGFYLWLGLRGVAPALVLASAINLLVTWQFAKRVPVPPASMTWMESFKEAGGMIKLGVVMMWTGLLSSLATYVTVKMITTSISLPAVGIYSAAFGLSGMFINFVLGAMAADYYPRLTGVAQDKVAMNRLVNEQTEIGLLLAVPGLLATLSLAPWVIHVFYTAEFLPAVALLQWFILGCLGRVVSWPLGFVMLALGKGQWYFATETSFIVLHVALIATLLHWVGLQGVAIAFSVLYLAYTAATWGVARHLIGFAWTPSSRAMLIGLTAVVVVLFIVVRTLSLWPGTVVGGFVTLVMSLYCLRGLVTRVGPEHRMTKLGLRVPGVRWLVGCRG